ncbi:hypothetical protein OU798_11530 [Prolixibacteraceae bacterium Z1-6]|uniref:Uncharacterized protein n=1 Tax=Draconibacterium aestuarii TaxID=2998507 RepID=A0A9X3J6Y4_9BACT|nr:hypothetical protein [Prolixibacteraceae bacterium Z1-6]
MKTPTTLFIVFLLIGFCSCSQTNNTPIINKVIELDEKSAQLIEADNAFGLELFQEIRTQSTDDNN